jgi:uncharacterized Zn-binding protein involved in type VI secretion
MANVARKSGTDTVTCTDGAKGTPCAFDSNGNPIAWNWNIGTTQNTDAGSSKVFSQGVGVVRQGDAMQSHPDGVPCTPSPINHAPTLSTYSSKVFVEGKGIGRVGDKYDSDGHYSHAISTGSPKVFAG